MHVCFVYVIDLFILFHWACSRQRERAFLTLKSPPPNYLSQFLLSRAEDTEWPIITLQPASFSVLPLISWHPYHPSLHLSLSLSLSSITRETVSISLTTRLLPLNLKTMLWLIINSLIKIRHDHSSAVSACALVYLFVCVFAPCCYVSAHAVTRMTCVCVRNNWKGWAAVSGVNEDKSNIIESVCCLLSVIPKRRRRDREKVITNVEHWSLTIWKTLINRC